MAGGGGGSPSPPPVPAYTPAPAFIQPPPFIHANPANSAFEEYVPQVETGNQVVGHALGDGVNPDLSNYGSGWLNLKNSPNDAFNMNQAENQYLQNTGLPQMSQDASTLNASGQAGSSFAGAYLGQEQAMNNLNAWNAGQTQNQNEFNNALNARSQLYSGPVSLEANQNNANVQRGLGVSNLDLTQTLAQNQYNMQGVMGNNSYNLGSNQIQNGFNSNIYGTQANVYGTGTQAATARRGQNLSFLGGLASGGLSLLGQGLGSGGSGGGGSGGGSLF